METNCLLCLVQSGHKSGHHIYYCFDNKRWPAGCKSYRFTDKDDITWKHSKIEHTAISIQCPLNILNLQISTSLDSAIQVNHQNSSCSKMSRAERAELERWTRACQFCPVGPDNGRLKSLLGFNFLSEKKIILGVMSMT